MIPNPNDFWRGVLLGGVPVSILFFIAIGLGFGGGGTPWQEIAMYALIGALLWTVGAATVLIVLYVRGRNQFATGMLVSLPIAWLAAAISCVAFIANTF